MGYIFFQTHSFYVFLRVRKLNPPQKKYSYPNPLHAAKYDQILTSGIFYGLSVIVCESFEALVCVGLVSSDDGGSQ
jgi:hypothetical protein